jgi:hypothetical protein
LISRSVHPNGSKGVLIIPIACLVAHWSTSLYNRHAMKMIPRSLMSEGLVQPRHGGAFAHAFAAGSKIQRYVLATASALLLAAGAGVSLAQPISVPNGSFESQSGVGQPFGVNVFMDSWQKPPNPGYPEGGANNFYWIQSAGGFIGTAPNSANPYSNLLGTQAAYMMSLPGAGIFQDNQSTDWSGAVNGLNTIYQVGQAYQLTVGLFGKGMVDNFSTLELSLYYRDNSNARVNVGSTTVTFNTTAFNPAGPFSFADYSVSLPTVQAGDAWAGRNIGISIASVQGTGDGYWDMDNVRLTAVPEPGVLALGVLGLGGWLLLRRRASRRA